jgi:hypothetical protein
MSNPTPTGQDEARRALLAELDRLHILPNHTYADCYKFMRLLLDNAELILAVLRAPSLDRGAEEWQPIADKPSEADWIVYLPDGAADGLGWALDPDEKLAALLWWKATSPTLSEITHFRKPIAGPSALAQQAKGEGEGGDNG